VRARSLGGIGNSAVWLVWSASLVTSEAGQVRTVCMGPTDLATLKGRMVLQLRLYAVMHNVSNNAGPTLASYTIHQNCADREQWRMLS
jgi:hypothetical protein